MADLTGERVLTVDQCEHLMMNEPFLSGLSPHLSQATGKALDRLTTDAGAFYGAGNWTVATSGENIHVPSPKEGTEPTFERTNAIMQTAFRELSQERDLQEELAGVMRTMGMPPRVQAKGSDYRGL